MKLLRQKTYSKPDSEKSVNLSEKRNKEVIEKTYSKTAASFKPKFRARFRKGDFSYVQAKDPSDEAVNHQAYKEVAAEDEFKNNPETYKIKQGMFSKKSAGLSKKQKDNILYPARETIKKATAVKDKKAAKVLKETANNRELLPEPIIRRDDYHVTKLNNYQEFTNKTKPSDRVKDPTIPGLEFEEVPKPSKQNTENGEIKTKQYKIRGTQYYIDTENNLWVKNVETGGNSRKLIKKDKNHELFDYSEDLTGIKYSTRDAEGKPLKKPKLRK